MDGERYKAKPASRAPLPSTTMPTYIFDDVFGDQRPGSNSPLPVYLPTTGRWDPVHGTCSQCSMATNIKIPVDATQVMNGTWHTATVHPGDAITNVTIIFTGKTVQNWAISIKIPRLF